MWGSKFEEWNVVFLPKTTPKFENKNFSELDLEGSMYHHCPLSKLYSSVYPEDSLDSFCAHLDHEFFLLKTRPWQCEIQVNLLVPEHLLNVHNFPGIFHYKYDFEFKFMPSLRPKIHFLLFHKIAQDSTNLIKWMSNFQFRGRNTKYGYWSHNDIHLSSAVICTRNQLICVFDFHCNILTISFIDYCFTCPTLFEKILLDNISLSFEHIELIVRNRVKKIYSGGFYDDDDLNKLSLPNQITYFVKNEPEAIIVPLKNLHKMKTRFSDYVQVLGFAYASVLKPLLVNVTMDPRPCTTDIITQNGNLLYTIK